MPTNLTSVTNGTISMPSVTKTTAPTSKDAQSALDKDAFLKLLAAQARSQDPMNPTDSTAQIAQLAQFSSLEQMNNMATEMRTMRTALDTQRATGLVGHTVTYKNSDGLDVTGTVDKVKLTSDGPLLTVGAVGDINPATLIEVR